MKMISHLSTVVNLELDHPKYYLECITQEKVKQQRREFSLKTKIELKKE